MATTTGAHSTQAEMEKANQINGHDHAEVAHGHGTNARRPYDYGGNPLATVDTNDSARLPAFGGYANPGSFRPPRKDLANPAPLGLSAFALTTFLLSIINVGAKGLSKPNIVIGAAFGYGGLVQLIAGIFEVVAGNTFGATALASYGGFWIGTAIILTPGGFGIETAEGSEFATAFSIYLFGWFIMTTLFMILTLRSTLAFFLLFFFLDLAFLMLSLGYYYDAKTSLIQAGGYFGLFAAFLAWYNAFAGMADRSNSFFLIPVVHFPWSDKGRAGKSKVDNDAARAAQNV